MQNNTNKIISEKKGLLFEFIPVWNNNNNNNTSNNDKNETKKKKNEKKWLKRKEYSKSTESKNLKVIYQLHIDKYITQYC